MKFTKKYIRELFNIQKDSIVPSIFIAFSLLLIFNPFSNIEVTSFNRQLGRGLLLNIDIVERINNMIKYNFVLAPILFLATFFIINLIFNSSTEMRKKDNKNSSMTLIKNKYNEEKCIKFINTISIVALVPLIFEYINRFTEKESTIIGIAIPFIMVIICLLYMVLNILNLRFDYKMLKWSIFASLPLTYLIGVIYFEFNSKLSIINLLFIYIIISLILVILTRILYKIIDFKIFSKAYILVMLAPMLVTIANEACNVLTQYSIIINFKVKIMVAIYGVLFLITFVSYFIMKYIRKVEKQFSFENWYYPIIVLTFSMIATQLSYQSIVSSDFFERANHGLAINSFLKDWSIPIVENFDAHMLQNQIGSIIYGLFNNDSIGAIFLEYSIAPLIFVTYYFMFKKFFNKDYALLIMLFFPIEAEKTFYVFPLAPFVILAFLYAYRNKNYKGYITFWISIAISALYRLDMGFAIAMASIITWVLMFILNKNKVSIKHLILSCIYVVVFCLITFISICVLKDINPIGRIFEVLRIIASNVNWGYDSIGTPEKISFIINYFMIPISVIFVVGTLIYKKYKLKDVIEDDNFIIALILGVIFIFNFSRGIVRHSLVENTNAFIISTYILFIGLAIALIKNKNRGLVFILTSISAFIISSMSMSNDNISIRPLIVNSIEKYAEFQPYTTEYKDGEKRFIIDQSMKEVYEPLKEVFDNVLNDDESYIDFTNQTLLYALTDRKNPVYINQSPGLLSGESLQQTFIKQCEERKDKLPFVLMPLEKGVLAQGMDGILNSYRYYLVTEYIANNYEPLFKNSTFAVWTRKDKVEEMKSLVSDYMNSDSKYKDEVSWIDYNYLNPIYHRYELENIPYIWAEYDEISVEEKEEQLSMDNSNLNEMVYDFNDIDKKDGNYLYINASSRTEQQITIKFGKKNSSEFEALNEFIVNIEPNENQEYLIRISGDFMWYSKEINAITVTTNDNEVIINNLSILKGDTLTSDN